MVAHTLLPSFDDANGRLSQESLIEIQKFCYHDNVTSHFFSLLESKIAIKKMVPSYLNLFYEYTSTISVYLWLSMARTETEYSLKKIGPTFSK